MALIRNGKRVESDPWVRVDDDAPLPDEAHVLVSLKRFLDDRETLTARNAPVGVALKADEAPDPIIDDLDRFQLIEVEFPQFKDGRGFSYGRLIRHRHGYEGELRAKGHVLVDQLLALSRCGFDAVDGDERITEDAWAMALGEFTVFYQPTGDGRPSVLQLRHPR